MEKTVPGATGSLVTRWVYGPDGNVVLEQGESYRREYVYAEGKLLGYWELRGTAEQKYYTLTDQVGSVVSTMDESMGNGTYTYVTDVDYLPNAKISQIDYGNDVHTTYDYFDTDGESDPTAGTWYSYRLKSIHIVQGTSTPIADTQYSYDLKDNVKTKSFTDGVWYYNESFEYDSLDRLTSAVSVELYGTKNYIYDALNNITLKDGRTYTYPLSGPSSVRPHAVANDGDYDYSYDANGNIVGRSDGRTIAYMATTIG